MTTLTAGTQAPDFCLPDDSGAEVSLADLRGKCVVLYFYPKDDTPGCTTESKDFAERMDAFAAAGAVILGVSKDDVKSHGKFKAKYCLPFPLLSDKEGDVCERYGVWGEKSMYGKTFMGITRATFLIDREGKLARIWPKVSVPGHAAEVLEAVQSL